MQNMKPKANNAGSVVTPTKTAVPPDLDPQHVEMIRNELSKKMNGMKGRTLDNWSQQAWKSPGVMRNPSVQAHFKDAYRRKQLREFVPIK